MLHISKHIWIAVARKEVHIHFSRKFLLPEIYGTILFLGVDNSSLVNCLPKRFLLSELLKFWDKKHTSSLVWYVVCIENVYFSICRCVYSNRWDFQFLVSSSFLFQRFLVAVIDNLIFSLLRSLDPLHMLWHMTFHTTQFLQHWTITGSFSTLTFLCCCDSSTFYPRF